MALLESFIKINPDSHFPIQNLPYGIFKPEPSSQPRPGVAIGDYILDLSQISSANFFHGSLLQNSDCFHQTNLNKFLQMGPPAWTQTRSILQKLLSIHEPSLRDNPTLRKTSLIPLHQAQLLLPITIPNYTDFFSSLHHATNCSKIFNGPDSTLHPNWYTIPTAYHGRASSVVVSGTDITRPKGLSHPLPTSTTPCFGPSKKLDFELEIAAVVGVENELGEAIAVDEAAEHIFGIVLMNDWSARDIQGWEYIPLGPFLGKSFGTSISPWIVTMEALRPFLCDAPVQDPPPPEYLKEKMHCSYDVLLEVRVNSHVVTRSNMKYLYWSLGQQLAHHTVNGCNLRVGDLLGSGTISGEGEDSFGSLLELTWGGRKKVCLSEEEDYYRVFLEDGDEVVITGWCSGDGYVVGFGECSGKILPSLV